ncbi:MULTISPECIES: PAS domain-containing protein [Kordiimonas]|jgi:hypothetical protein|uniref:PAS domain-containing protein n=1 Tax=Kordiimonas TaxID=288021 RepID=UPI00257B7445|nr:PAS domain-containing protein [Kordiimonas sp. UBA4487]
MVPGDAGDGSLVSSFEATSVTNQLDSLPSASADMQLLVGESSMQAGIRSADLRDMFNHYLSLRPSKGVMPSREAFNPAALPRHLPNIFLVEIELQPDGKPNYRYKVFGTALSVLFGAEMTGKLVSEFPDPNRAERSRRILDHVALLRRPVRTAGNFVSKNGMSVFGESIVLPFGEGDKVTHVLADLDYDQHD